MSEQNINDGGPAFPVSTRPCYAPGEYGHQDSDDTWQFGGMSLRDYFAGQALVGLISATQPSAVAEMVRRGWTREAALEMYAKDSCDIADALIAELRKGGAM